MATNNSTAQTSAQQNVDASLEKREEIHSDDYIGTKEQLIAAGLAKQGQFPGDPGRGKMMVSYDPSGRAVGQGRSRNGGIQIRRAGRSRFCVSVRVQDEERERRYQAVYGKPAPWVTPPTSLEAAEASVARLEVALQDARATAARLRNGPWKDPGLEEAGARMRDSQSMFKPGDSALYWSDQNNDMRDGEPVEIVGAYGLAAVTDADGPYVGEDGLRCAYRWGYLGRMDDGEKFFFPAHNLRAPDGTIRHLCLVKS